MDKPNRMTVDLSPYPDLVVIYLGMRVNAAPRGVRTLLSYWPKIKASVKAAPDGLLLHENLQDSLLPPHLGMRQYWRDFDSLERWHMICRTRHGAGLPSGRRHRLGTRRTSVTEQWSRSSSTCRHSG